MMSEHNIVRLGWRKILMLVLLLLCHVCCAPSPGYIGMTITYTQGVFTHEHIQYTNIIPSFINLLPTIIDIFTF